VENVLQDDETVYRGLTPDLDFTLSVDRSCYIAEVLIWPGDAGPNEVEIYVADYMDGWAFVKNYSCAKSGVTRLVVPGEHVAKYLRVRCLSNTRGGKIVAVRHIQIKGLELHE
jgi:hypothetical protein